MAERTDKTPKKAQKGTAPATSEGVQVEAPKPSKRKVTKEQKARVKQQTATAASKSAPRPSKRSRLHATATGHSEIGEKLIAGVPARIMRPRLVFIFCLVSICLFGLLMVFSASAVESLKENDNAFYYLIRQSIFMVLGGLLVVFMSGRFGGFPTWNMYRSGSRTFWLATLVLLLAVLFIGTGGDSWGASRWIPLPFFNLQPAELAKPAVILVMANLFASHYEDGTLSVQEFVVQGLIVLASTLVLILAEPDLGTSFIIFAAVFCMLFIAGLSWRWTIGTIVLGLCAIAILVIAAPYRFNRFMIAFNPWSDPYGLGYQPTLAIMAFASGGVFGRGIGNSTMKYNYLPEAHNDYILAIIGEELGFVGTLIFIAVYLLMIYAAFRIAMRSPTFYGQMLAMGSALVIAIQFFVNVMGIVGWLPMTGKPLPFVSYGGSSVITSLMLAGMIIRVSLESNVETAADRRRAGFSVMHDDPYDQEDVSAHLGRSTAGTVRTRSSRASMRRSDEAEPTYRRSSGFRVFDGGRSDAPPFRDGRRGDDGLRRSSPRREGPYERINLNGDGSGRLRHDGMRTRVDYSDITRSARPRRSGDNRSGSSSRGNRYDR